MLQTLYLFGLGIHRCVEEDNFCLMLCTFFYLSHFIQCHNVFLRYIIAFLFLDRVSWCLVYIFMPAASFALSLPIMQPGPRASSQQHNGNCAPVPITKASCCRQFCLLACCTTVEPVLVFTHLPRGLSRFELTWVCCLLLVTIALA